MSGQPDFTGRWALCEKPGTGPEFSNTAYLTFLSAIGVDRSLVDIAIAKLALVSDSQQLIVQHRDGNMTVLVSDGDKSRFQRYVIGREFTETDLNGAKALVQTSWEGDVLKEKHVMAEGGEMGSGKFGYTVTRSIDEAGLMILEVVVDDIFKAKAKRCYKRI